MGAIYRNGSTAYTLGTGGTASTLRLGSTGTTTYTLGGSGLVNGHYTLGGVTTSYSLNPGDTATTSYTLKNGLSSYNLNTTGLGSTSYSLNPSGGSTGTNLQMGTKTGTTAYTLGSGSSTLSTAKLKTGSAHNISLSGTGSGATITTTISGVTNTVTLVDGDSAGFTIVADAEADLTENLTGDGSGTKSETTTYDLGTGGTSSTTYGANSYGVYLVLNFNFTSGLYQGAPYLAIIADGSDADAKSFPFESGGMGVQWATVSVWDNITIETPTGSDTVQNETTIGNYQINYNCQRWRIGTVSYDGTKWNVTQTLLGQITLPDEVYGVGVLRYAAGGSHPWEDGTWPLFANENAAWWGSWNNYTKDGDASSCTVPVNP